MRVERSGDVSFALNRRDLGVAFRGLPGSAVLPAAMLYLPNSIEFEGQVEYF